MAEKPSCPPKIFIGSDRICQVGTVLVSGSTKLGWPCFAKTPAAFLSIGTPPSSEKTESPDAHLGSNRTGLFSDLLFAIIGQSALTVAPNFAMKFFSTDRVNSISVLYGQ